MSTKSVKFGKDSSSSSGSRSSHGSTYGHDRSDSGVVSDYEDQRYTVTALQNALHCACQEREDWKNDAVQAKKEVKDLRDKLWEAKREIADARKALEESDAARRAAADHAALVKDELEAVKRELEKALRSRSDKQGDAPQAKKQNGSPPTSVANGGTVPPGETPRRRNSMSSSKAKREKDAEKAEKAEKAERAEKEKEKEKLRGRFERADESDRSGSSGGRPHRSRRESYIEPMGPAAQRPAAPVPPPSSRHYSDGPMPSQYPSQYPSMRDSIVSPVRSLRPTVPVVTTVYNDSPFDVEDGTYHAYPLPNQGAKLKDRR